MTFITSEAYAASAAEAPPPFRANCDQTALTAEATAGGGRVLALRILGQAILDAAQLARRPSLS